MSSTSLDPRTGQWLGRLWRAGRAPAFIALLVLLAALVIAVTAERGTRGLLDPHAVDGSGSRALAEVLRGQGVAVEVARDAEQIRTAGAGTSVFVPFPGRVTPEQFAALRAAEANLVVVAPEEAALAELTAHLAAEVQVSGMAAVDVRESRCGLPAAEAAGNVELGGTLYTATGPAAAHCYPAPSDPDQPDPDEPHPAAETAGAALVSVSDQGRTVSIVGTSVPFTNDALAHEGNAALTLRLLGTEPRLLWFLPAPAAAEPGADQSFVELVPAGWFWGTAQLAVAVLLVALWRARRLGPVVAEPLPVVVRGAETVEGQGRLYHRAGDRGHAASALREAARHRLRPLAGTPPHASAESVLTALADRTHRSAAELRELLYGAAPADDAALVWLADELDALESEVRRS